MKAKIFLFVVLLPAAIGLMGQTVITTPQQLHNVRYDLTGDYILGNNIDLDPAELGPWYDEVYGWNPIGGETNPFTGNFDGNGYEIANLTMNRPESFCGLFGAIGNTSLVSNVTISNAQMVSVLNESGILVGSCRGNMENCHSSGSITSSSHTIGGLVGKFILFSSDFLGIYNCSSDATVQAGSIAGGLLGNITGGSPIPILESCFATGNVTISGSEAGGLVGRQDYNSVISNCYARGNVYGGDERGGLIGRIYNGSIRNIQYSYCSGYVGSVGDYNQPFIGRVIVGSPNITYSYYNRSVTGLSTNGLGEGRYNYEMTDPPYSSNTYEYWNFWSPVWMEDSDEKNDGYPYLQWQTFHPEPIFSFDAPAVFSCGVYSFPVKVQDFMEVGSLNLRIEYNPSPLNCISVDIPDPQIDAYSVTQIDNISGIFTLIGNYSPLVDLTDNDILCILRFSVQQWDESNWFSWPTWYPGVNQVTGFAGAPLYSSTFNEFWWTAPVVLHNEAISVGNNDCFGDTDGSINITVTGGTPPYSFGWTGPNGFTASTEDVYNLVSGNYNVNVSDDAGCGYSAMNIAIDVLDNTPPQISTCPTDFEIEGCSVNDLGLLPYSESQSIVTAGDYYSAGGVASDNCIITFYAYQDASGGNCPITVTRTWTLKDGMNNTNMCVQTIIIDDNTPPILTCPGNLTISCTDPQDPGSTGQASATDNCDAMPIVTYSDATISGSCTGNYTITRTWSATDDCNNISSSDQVITVEDNVPPVLICPGNLTISCTDPQDPGSTGQATANDNCDASPIVTYSDAITNGNCPGNYTITRTWTATDNCTNESSYDQIVTVQDVVSPVISSCPQNVEAYMNDGYTAINLDLGIPIFSDNCDPSPVASHDGVEPFPEGPTTVTWTVTDACGNESTCTQTVTVLYNSLGGVMEYNNGGQSLASVILTMNDGVTEFNATTDGGGIYSFPALPAGTYSLSADFGTNTVGGINATDAALANYWGVSPWEIESVRFYAGDAAPNNYVDATDAGRVLEWFVQEGDPEMDNPWSFWVSGEIISANPSPPPSGMQYPEIIIGGSEPVGNLIQNLLAMVTGDFNNSYTSATKASGGSVLLLAGDVFYVEPGTSFDLPITAGMDLEVGALSLIFTLPQDKFVVEQVYLGNDPSATLLYHQTQDRLRTGWITLEAFNLAEGETLLTLKMTLLQPIDEGFEFTLADDPLNELVDGEYEGIDGAELVVDVLTTSTVGLGKQHANGLTLGNWPNPFNEATTFGYSIPERGHVTLEVYDLLGNRVGFLVDEMQVAGVHESIFRNGSLQPGVYLANLQLDSYGNVRKCTIRIIHR